MQNVYLTHPFERNGLISELHYGQLVNACERYETRYKERSKNQKGLEYAERFANVHTVMKTESVDIFTVPTVTVKLGNAGVPTRSIQVKRV